MLSIFVCMDNVQLTFACPNAVGRKAANSSVSSWREGSSWGRKSKPTEYLSPIIIFRYYFCKIINICYIS